MSSCDPSHDVHKVWYMYLISDVFEVWFEVLLCTVQESLGLEVSCTKGEQIHGCESGLLARRDKHNDRQLGGMLADGMVDRFHHGDETRGSVGDVKSLCV